MIGTQSDGTGGCCHPAGSVRSAVCVGTIERAVGGEDILEGQQHRDRSSGDPPDRRQAAVQDHDVPRGQPDPAQVGGQGVTGVGSYGALDDLGLAHLRHG